jgi:3-dehydroquinate synthase II
LPQTREKEIIVEAESPEEAEEAVAAGASAILVKEAGKGPPRVGAKIYVLGENVVPVKVSQPSDIEEVYRIASSGAEAILVETSEMRIIPLENILARLQGTGAKVFTRISSLDEAEASFGILEKGVDGVIYRPSSIAEIGVLVDMLKRVKSVELRAAKVREVYDVGMGERACVDTIAMLRYGEGMLVGSMARMLFLVHNESIGSKFTPPRPFRVNAGAVHLYTLSPTGKTLYLSELRAGTRILTVSKDGSTRVVTVGRVKIERRPMVQVNAEVDGVLGAATLQKAETIRLVTPKGEVVDITSLSPKDEVLCWLSPKAARHMGMEVDEYIDEV